MTRVSRISIWLVCFALILSGVSATAETRNSVSSFNVLVEEQASIVHFSVQGENIISVRVAVLSLGGKQIFDSNWVTDQTVIWPMVSQSGQPVASGIYLYVITVRDQVGQEQRRLGKLALVLGQEPTFTVSSVGQLATTEPAAAQFPLPPGTSWSQRLGGERSDTYRILRRPARLPGGPPTSFEQLLQLGADGKLHIKQLCLGTVFAPYTPQNPDNLSSEGDCSSSWTSGGGSTSNGWVDDGTVVRLETSTDKVGIGTTSPTELLTVAGNIDATGQKSKIRFQFDTLADLPSATTYHGMFAHVHSEGKAYFAHAGAWVPLANAVHTHTLADIANQDCGAGKVIQGWTAGALTCVSVGGGGLGSGWSLTGNAGTNPATNFLGTTDSQPLLFRTSNLERMRIDASGNVGIGTTSPAAKLHVNGAEEGIRIQGTAAGASNLAYATFYDAVGTRIGYVGDGSIGDKNVFLDADMGDVVLNTLAGRILTATSTGNVGIGATSPQAKLDVRGDVKLGNNGQYFATSGEENLRIVRGNIEFNGTVKFGSGFQVSNPSKGTYIVTFNTPFSSTPAVVATTERIDFAPPSNPSLTVVQTKAVSPSQATFRTIFLNGSDAPAPFEFIAIGPR